MEGRSGVAKKKLLENKPSGFRRDKLNFTLICLHPVGGIPKRDSNALLPRHDQSKILKFEIYRTIWLAG